MPVTLLLFSTKLPVLTSLIATLYLVALVVEFHLSVGVLSVNSVPGLDDEPGDFSVGFGGTSTVAVVTSTSLHDDFFPSLFCTWNDQVLDGLVTAMYILIRDELT